MPASAPRAPVKSAESADADASLIRLGFGRKGLRGTIVRVGIDDLVPSGDGFVAELERRLLEMGLVEGATIEILHEGFIGRDPIAVQVDDMRVALRRREANAILVRIAAPDSGASTTAAAAASG